MMGSALGNGVTLPERAGADVATGPVVHEREPHAVCPYCNYVKRDTWEINFHGEECTTTTCGLCDRDFALTQHIDVAYTSRPLSQDGSNASPNGDGNAERIAQKGVL